MKQFTLILTFFCLLAADFMHPIDVLPPGFKVIREAKGDLTGDGIEDVARILQKEGTSTGDEERMLQIHEGDAKAGPHILIENSHAIMLSSEGGMMGDPLDGISIKNGSLFISYYGGSAWRWGITFQFKMRDGAISLIGREDESFNVNTNEKKTTSTNYLSGKRLIRERKFNEETGKLAPWIEIWEKPGRKPLIKLVDFKIQEQL